MGADQKTVKVVVEATNNEFTLASGELIAKTRDILLDRRRSDIASQTWAMLSEDDQKREVSALTEYAEDLVHGLVEVIAAGNFDVIHAKLDNFKSKDGSVTVTAKGTSSDGALIALNRIGHKHLKIIVADEEQFDQHRDTVPIDADQPEMFEGDDDGDDVIDPETGELTSGDDTTQAVIDAVEKDEANNDDGELQDAKELGVQAHDYGDDPDDNPYDEDEPELKSAWFNGYYERKNEARGDPFQEGLTHREEEGTTEDNPYDVDTDSHAKWLEGFDRADEQLLQLEKEGGKAAAEGVVTIDDSGWKTGSSADTYWRKGFQMYHDEQAAQAEIDAAEAKAQSKDENSE